MDITAQAEQNTAALARLRAVPYEVTPTGTDSLLKIRVKVKDVYGKPLVYVQSFHQGPLNILTGQKTLGDSQIKALKALGYVFEGLEG